MFLKYRQFLLINFFVTTLLIASFHWSSCNAAESENIQKLYGEHSISILRDPDSVYAALLQHDSATNTLLERSKRVIVPPGSVVHLTQTLLSDQSYLWESAKLCIPSYGARLVFERSGDAVTIDFCFECDILQVLEQSTSKDFDPSRREFVSIFKEIFPSDETVQGLK